MQRAPDRKFGESFSFGWGAGEPLGLCTTWGGQGSSSPSNGSYLLAACIRKGEVKCLPELTVCVRELQAYTGNGIVGHVPKAGLPRPKKPPSHKGFFSLLPELPPYIQVGDAADSQLRHILGNICTSGLYLYIVIRG